MVLLLINKSIQVSFESNLRAFRALWRAEKRVRGLHSRKVAEIVIFRNEDTRLRYLGSYQESQLPTRQV
jgi:hypothetical protein